MTTAYDVIAQAEKDLGYAENPPGSNRTKFGIFYGLDGNPWCAMALSYWFFNAGLALPATTPKGFAYVPSGVNWFKAKGWFTNSPRIGDAVFYKFGVRPDHIGIVTDVYSDGSIQTIEGNTALGNDASGGRVMRRRRAAGIYGYGRPPYSASPVPSQPDPIEIGDNLRHQMTNVKLDPDGKGWIDVNDRTVEQFVGAYLNGSIWPPFKITAAPMNWDNHLRITIVTDPPVRNGWAAVHHNVAG